jgi:hypothetical protein
MDSSALTLSPNKAIHSMDNSGLTISPNKSIHSTALDTAQRRPILVRPKDTFTGVLEESQETLAGIDLSPNHVYRRRCRQQQGSCQDQGSLLVNLNKPVLSSSETKPVQGARHSCTRNTSYSNKKTVRFGDHHDHCSNRNSLSVHVQVHTIEPIPRKYRDQLYWTEPQIIQLQRSAKLVVAHYSKDKKPYVAAIHRILQSHRSSNHNSVNNGTDSANTTAASDVVQVMVESAARGLEARIVPALKYYRKRTVRAVLELQCELRIMSREHGHNDGHAEQAVHLLRRKSLQASRPCRHLARQLALGDAAAAHIHGPPSSSMSSVLPMPTLAPATTTPMPTPSAWLQEQHTIVEP